MENIRTLCEYNATHVDVLCRKSAGWRIAGFWALAGVTSFPEQLSEA